jgi:hypothetical protein
MELAAREQGAWALDLLVRLAVRYGHGFAILRIALPGRGGAAAAAKLAAAIRGADVITRWDEHELLVLLPDADRAGAALAAERLRAAAEPFPIVIGAAHWAGDTAPDLLERAARALA